MNGSDGSDGSNIFQTISGLKYGCFDESCGVWCLNNAELNNEIIGPLSILFAFTRTISLELSGNEIHDDGAIHLANAIKHSSSIRNVNLNSNKIGNRGAIALAEAIKANQNLKSFSIKQNLFNDPMNGEVEGELALQEAIASHRNCNKN